MSARVGKRNSVILVAPTRGWRFLNLRDLWEYRELVYFLTWRDLKVRYKQTAIGAAWAIIQPLAMMLVFSVFFGRLARASSGDLPYPVFAYAALVPWMYFAGSLSQATNSLVEHQKTITKIYFPRILLPLSSVLGGIVDLAISSVVLVGMMVFYHIRPTWAILTLPLFVLFAMMTALGVGLWLSALNVQYRDVRYAMGFLTLLWFFATPIAYPMSVVPQKWEALYGLNPMVGVVEGFRRALLGRGVMSAESLAASVSIMILILVGGIFYFRRIEHTLADVV